MVHVGASTETKIAHHKSTMENLLLYREKNEVAGMGEKKKIGTALSTGRKEVQAKKENARATERK